MQAQLSLLNSTNVRNAMAFAWTRLHLALTSAFVPSIAVEKAQRLFLTPPRIAHSQRERELLASGKGFAVQAPHGRLAAWRFGRGDRPAVIVSHGWGGRGAQLRAFVPALVEAGYQAIVFDHAAHGHSEGREASLVHFIDDLEAIAKALDASGARIAGAVGHSLGAAALGGWLKKSGRSARVVLIAPPSSVERYSTFFARALGLSERVRREMQRRIEHRLGTPWSAFELPGAVAGIEAPALVIHDADDREVPSSAGLAVARAWKDARHLETTRLGHRRILRSAQVVRDAIDFLRDDVRFAPAPQAFGETAPSPLY
jgi:pimeloyl-ACP methyl ester carboxylesterase